MKQRNKTLRICKIGHRYYKSTDYLTCPVCENDKKTTADFLSSLSAPALRALNAKGIKTLKQLSGFTEKEILALHGMGKSTIPKLKAALKEKSLSFKSLRD